VPTVGPGRTVWIRLSVTGALACEPAAATRLSSSNCAMMLPRRDPHRVPHHVERARAAAIGGDDLVDCPRITADPCATGWPASDVGYGSSPYQARPHDLNPNREVSSNLKSRELRYLCSDTIHEVADMAEGGLDRIGNDPHFALLPASLWPPAMTQLTGNSRAFY
jgi:hypothetical protein